MLIQSWKFQSCSLSWSKAWPSMVPTWSKNGPDMVPKSRNSIDIGPGLCWLGLDNFRALAGLEAQKYLRTAQNRLSPVRCGGVQVGCRQVLKSSSGPGFELWQYLWRYFDLWLFWPNLLCQVETDIKLSQKDSYTHPQTDTHRWTLVDLEPIWL